MMLDFQQKRKVRGVMYHRATLIILAILVLVFTHSTWVVYQKKRDSEDMKNLSLQNVIQLRQRNTDLQSKIDRLDTTPGIEDEIRSKFSVIKEDENMVVIVEDQGEDVSTTTTESGIWQKIKTFFGSK